MKIPTPVIGKPTVDVIERRRWISLSAEPFRAEVKALAVSFAGLSHPFFVHYANPGDWRVTEANSGHVVGKGKTRDEALNTAQKRLANYIAKKGVAAFKSLVAQTGSVEEVKEATGMPEPIRFN